MTKYVKTRQRYEEVKSKLEFFKEGNEGRYPPGVRPFKFPIEQEALGHAWSKSSENGYQITIKIPKDTTRSEAMGMIHWSAAGMLKAIELEAIESQITVLKEKASKQTLMQACATIMKDAMDKTQYEKLGLEEPMVALVSDAHFHKEYRRDVQQDLEQG